MWKLTNLRIILYNVKIIANYNFSFSIIHQQICSLLGIQNVLDILFLSLIVSLVVFFSFFFCVVGSQPVFAIASRTFIFGVAEVVFPWDWLSFYQFSRSHLSCVFLSRGYPLRFFFLLSILVLIHCYVSNMKNLYFQDPSPHVLAIP